MFDLIKFAAGTAKTAIVDRKGVTAVEYALIAAAVAAVIAGGYKFMFSNLNTFVRGVTFS